MARKTKPVAQQVIGPYIRTNAYLKARLIDFDTGKAELEGQHKTWLTEKMHYAKRQSGYQIWVIGYASKLGSEKDNLRLSNARMNAVLTFIGKIDSRALNSIQTWQAQGEGGYIAKESDDSADMRAVEVHIFIGSPPPPPPPNIKPTPRPVPPLPGGKRYSKWSMAAPGGGSGSPVPGVVIGFNMFIFRNDETNEMRGYISPQGGLGWSYSLKGLKGAWDVLQKVLTSPSGSGVDFTPQTTKLPITWKELEESLATVSSVGGGVGKYGVAAAHITIDAPSVWHYGPSGVPLRNELRLFEVNTAGKNFQLGIGGSAVTGPLVRIDD